MLNEETMLTIDKGFLLKHSEYSGLWVVVNRDYDMLTMILCNTTDAVNLMEYVDCPDISLFEC